MNTTRFAQSILQRTQVLQTLRLQRREKTVALALYRASRRLLRQAVGISARLRTLHYLSKLQLHILQVVPCTEDLKFFISPTNAQKLY
jgi:hypothetical protein